MPPPSDFSPLSPQPPTRPSSILSWFAASMAQAPATEAPLALPRDWDLLDLDQRVRTIGEW